MLKNSSMLLTCMQLLLTPNTTPVLCSNRGRADAARQPREVPLHRPARRTRTGMRENIQQL
jgi:hypothetical protein